MSKPDKPEVYAVQTQVQARTGNDPGQVTIGYYTIADGVLTMTDGDGFPMRRTSGEFFTHKLAPDDNPRLIAGRLTREVRMMVHGDSGNFNRRLHYPDLGIV